MKDSTGKTITLNGANIAFDSTNKKFGAGSLKITAAGSYASMSSYGFKDFGTRNFTIDFWIYRTAVNDTTYADAIFAPSTGPAALAIGINPDGKIGYALNSGGATWDIRNGVDPATPRGVNVIPLNTWTHVALVRNGSTFTGYVNGMFDQSFTSSAAISAFGSTVYIGHWHDTWVRTFIGSIDEFRIRLDEVVWNNNFTTPIPSFSLNTNSELDNLQYTKLLIKGNGYNGSTLITDECGKSITLSGSASISTAQSKFGGSSIALNNNDTLALSTTADWNFTSSDSTIELWMNLTSLTQSAQIIGTESGSLGNWMLYVSTSGLIALGVNNSGVFVSSLAGAITTNVWTHVAIAKSGATTSIYVNGISVASGTNSYYNNPSVPLYIGTPVGRTGWSFNGYVQDIRITNGLARYTSNFTVPGPINAVDYTKLLLKCNGYNNSTNIIDECSNKLTINGNAKISTAQSKFGGSSLAIPLGSSVSLPATNSELSCSDKFTIEFWIYLNSIPADMYFFDIGGSNTAALERYSGQLRVVISGTGYAAASWTPVINTWYHIALTRDSANLLRTFVNGTLIGSQVYTGNFGIANGTMYIGAYNAASYGIDGYIDDFRLYKGYAKYTSAFTAPIAAQQMLSYYPQYVNNTDRTVFLINANGANNSTSVIEATGKPITVNSGAKISTTQSKFGGSSLYFNGTTAYINTPSNNDFNFGFGDFTIEWWQYTSNLSTLQMVFSRQSSASGWNNIQWYLLIDTTGTLTLVSSDGSGRSDLFGVSNCIVINTWQHIAIVRQSKVWRCFINGVEATTYPGAGYNNSMEVNSQSSQFNLGGFPGWAFFAGYIDDFRIYNGVAKYTANFTVPTTQQVLSTVGDRDKTVVLINGNGSNNSANIFDATGKTVTVYGNARIRTTQSKFGGSSIYFDGTGDYLNLVSSADFALSTNDFTFELWSYPTSFATLSVLLTTNVNGGFYVNINATTGTVTVGRTLVASDGTTSNSCTLNSWNHIAISRASGTLKIFINGVQGYSGANTLNYVQGDLLIGVYNGSTYYYTGYMQDIRLINGSSLYTTDFTPSTSQLSLISYLPSSQYTDSYSAYDVLVLKGEGAIGKNNLNFTDQSTNSHLITINGVPSQGLLGPYEGFNSANFNGSTDGLNIPVSIINDLVGSHTIEMWIYPKTTPAGSGPSNGQPILWGFAGGSTWHGYSIASTGYTVMSNTGSYLLFTGNIPALNSWSHLAFVSDGTTLSVYLNGVNVASGSVAGTWNTNATSGYIGQASTYSYFNGYISNFHVTKSAKYTSAFTPSTTPIVADANTTLLLNFDNAAIIDSTRKNNIVTGGNATITSIKKVGQSALSFDGTSDYLAIPDSTDFDFGSSNFTIEFWIKFNAFNDRSCIISKRHIETEYAPIGLIDMATGTINLYAAIGSATWTINNAVLSPVLTLNVWYHFALVRNGNIWTAYTNGIQTWTGTYSGALYTNNRNMSIGGLSDGTYSINGNIDHLRIKKGVAIYKTDFIPPYADAMYALNQSSKTSLLINGTGTNGSTTIVESTGKALTVTGTGLTISNTQSKFGSTSIYSDGTGGYMSVPSSSDLTLTDDFTIEFWFRDNGSTVTNPTLLTNNYAWTAGTFLIGYNVTGYSNKVTIHWNGATPSDPFISSSSTFATGIWHHVALTRSNGICTLFVNGVNQGSVSYTATLNLALNGTMYIGRSIWTTASYYKGYLQDIRVTKGASLYSQAGFAVPTSAYTLTSNKAYSTLLLLHANDSTDSSIYSKTVTLLGSASIDTTTKKFGTGSFAVSSRGNLVSLADSDDWNFNTNCTIEFWFRPTSITGGGSLIGQNSINADGNWFAYVYATGAIGVGLSGISEIVSASGIIGVNNWHHVAIVKTETTVTIYINGTSVVSSSASTVFNVANTALVIGTPSGQTGFTGLTMNVDEVRISNFAVYKANFTVQVNPFER